MSSTFQRSPKYLWTSESVTEGHPDKVCDQLSDAILDWCLTQTPSARVACEASVKSDDSDDWVWIYGEVTPLPPPEVVDGLVRRTLSDIGYTDRTFGTSAETAQVEVHLIGQSADIALGVDRSLEAKKGDQTDEFDTGAGDQGMMIGFACNETPEYMPMALALSHRLTRRLAEVRKNGLLPWLRPDGKSQVTVEYSYGEPVRVDTIVISTQHDDDVAQEEIESEVRKHVIEPVVDAKLMDTETRFLIKPDRSIRHRRSLRRLGAHRPKDYCRYLWWYGPPWWRCFQWQRPNQGGPLRCIRCPLGCKKCGCSRPRDPLRGPASLCDWRRDSR